jgi:hypothetical protein
MNGWLLGLGLVLVAGPHHQTPDLGPTAEQARRSLQAHDVEGLLGSSSRILLQLPSVAPSAPVGRAHAAALLSSYLNDFEEVTTEVRSVAPAGDRSGTVELRRTYRVPGTAGLRSQSVLLAYQLAAGRWVLTEVRISG